MKSTPIGIVAGFVLVYGAIFMGPGWQTFFDPVSLTMVVGGTAAALMVAFSFDELKTALAGAKRIFSHAAPDLNAAAGTFVDLARTARREGLLALDRALAEIDDPFMSFGLEMAVDGVEEGEVAELLREKLDQEAKDLGMVPKFMNTAGTYCPAFGMVGTLVGLIQMLQNLSDPAAIGPAMSIAMITTFYGALLANLIFLPLASISKAQGGELLALRKLQEAGILGIVRGEAPSMLEKRLALFTGGTPEAAEAADVKKAA